MKRIKKLLKAMQAENIEGLLLTSEANITYLTGFTGDSSRLILSAEGVVFITDGRYTEQAEMECHKEIKILKWIDDIRYGVETYGPVCKGLGIKKLGFEGELVNYYDYIKLSKGLKNIELIPVSGMVEGLRIIKDEAEVDCLRTACKISELALEKTLDCIKEGVSEIEVLAHLEYNLKTGGADDLSFETMVLSGAKTSLLHGKASSKKIEKGDFILFDFGALYKGYHADISRTFVLGKADKLQKEMYDTIFRAQAAGCQAVKDGVHGTEADKAVRNEIDNKFIEYYYPGLGHGVGLEIHENPFIKNTCDFVFRKNMTLTIEPGIYLPGIGGLRIEDTIRVGDNDYESLSQFPRELIEL